MGHLTESSVGLLIYIHNRMAQRAYFLYRTKICSTKERERDKKVKGYFLHGGALFEPVKM